MSPSNARNSIAQAALGAVALNLINQYVQIFAVKLGATNLQLGYLSSWPQLASVISVLVIAGAVSRSRNQQRMIGLIHLLGRGAGLLAAAVPWFPEPVRVWALIGSWILVVFPTAAAGNSLQAFLADVFPGSERARAFATRNSWGTGVGTATVLISGWLLDYLLPYPLGYQILFACSFLVALVEVYYFSKLRQADPVTGAAKPGPARVGFSTYLQTLNHRPFRNFLWISVPFHFTWQMAWPMFTRFQVTDLGANNTWMSYISVAGSLAMIFAFPRWARLADRYSNGAMMGWAALHLATAPFLTAVLASIKLQVFLNLWTGMGVAGISLLILNNLLDVSPAEGRPVYLAVHSALVSFSAFVAPMAGAMMMELMPTRSALALATIPRVLAAGGFFLWFYLNRHGKGKASGTENLSLSGSAR